MRAAIYARVSSDKQRERCTIEGQLTRCRAFVQSQGWIPVGEYIDDGFTARTGHLDAREDFARLQRDVQAKKMDVVVALYLDRFTRSDEMIERASVLGPFQRCGVAIATPDGGVLDLRTMYGELYANLQAIFDAEDNRKRAERTKIGQRRVSSSGGKGRGPTPFGLRYDRDTRTWGHDEAKAKLVVELFTRVRDGESCLQVARDFFDRNIPSPRGPWNPNVTWRIINSQHVIGQWLADKDQGIIVPVPRIIDDELFFAVQAKLKACGSRGLRRTSHVYLLEDMARCGLCGDRIFIASAAPKENRLAKYSCRSDLRGRPGQKCRAPRVVVSDLDARVWQVVADRLASPDVAAALRQLCDAQREKKVDHEGEIAAQRHVIARLERKQVQLLAMFRNDDEGLITQQQLTAELRTFAEQRAAAQAKLDAAAAAVAKRDEQTEDPDAWISSLRELASTTAPADRAAVVREFVKPGAVLSGEQLSMIVRFDPSLVLHPSCWMQHETSIEFRVVA